MGGIAAKPNILKVDAVSGIINESILKLSGSTSNDNNFGQYIEANDESTVSGNLQYANVRSSASSVVGASQNSNFDTSVAITVKQELEKKTVALLGAFDGLLQNNNVDLTTNIGANIHNLNLMEIIPICANNNSITQSIVANRGSSVIDNKQIVKADFVTSCISTVSSNLGTVSDITNTLNQKATVTSENPLDFLADIFKGGMMMVIIVIIAIVVGFVVLVGPGNLDANALITQGFEMASKSGPQGKLSQVSKLK